MQPTLFQMNQPSATTRRRICDLPAEDRPVYRLNHAGSGAMTTGELLTLILGTEEGPGLADDLLANFGSIHKLAAARKHQLMKVRGIGEAQASRLLALVELSRRLQDVPADERPTVSSPRDGAKLLAPKIAHLQQEELWTILLNTRNHVIAVVQIYKGSLNSSVVRVGEIFKFAIEASAAAIIIAHNHPSGNPSPSPEDVQVTREIVKAGKLLGIDVLDHLIITTQGHTSLKEKGQGF